LNKLFDSTFSTQDRELENLLAQSDRTDVREFLEDLWQSYCPRIAGEERSFRGDLKAQPHGRLWEMYLAVALERSDLNLAVRLKEGPDVRLQNPTVWVEAVASTDGMNEGMQSLAKTPEVLLSDSMWGGPDEEKIIRRCLASIKEKLGKLHGYNDRKGKHHRGYIAKGIVNETEPYVIALNTHKISHAHLDHQYTPNHIPLIAKALFGYGKAMVVQYRPIDGFSAPLSRDRIDYEYRGSLKGGDRTDVFFQEKYSAISAVIVSKAGLWTWQNRIPEFLSDGFILVHNPLAKNPLPKNWLRSGHEIWIEQAQLHKLIWKKGTEHSREGFPLPLCWLSNHGRRRETQD